MSLDVLQTSAGLLELPGGVARALFEQPHGRAQVIHRLDGPAGRRETASEGQLGATLVQGVAPLQRDRSTWPIRRRIPR